MWFDDLKARDAFRRGAREAYESAFIHMDARHERAVSEWINDLEDWTSGEPPPAPADW